MKKQVQKLKKSKLTTNKKNQLLKIKYQLFDIYGVKLCARTRLDRIHHKNLFSILRKENTPPVIIQYNGHKNLAKIQYL
jgi:hypothetical protein